MKKLLTAAMTSAIALSTLGAGVAVAADQHRHERREDRQERREDRRERIEDRRERQEDRREWAQDRREDRRDYRRYVQAQRRFDAPSWAAPRGYAYRPYRYGQVLPAPYRVRSYAIHQPQRYYLDPAPYGYQWHRVGNDAVLSSLSNGLIMSVVSGLFY